MNILDPIHARRSVKQFTDREITRDEIERLLEAAVQAPNHRMTEPWCFYVLGPRARRAFGRVLGGRKAKRVEDPAAAQAVIDKVSESHASLPAMIAVAMVLDENPEIQAEDFASMWMAVQNLCLAAHATGLGTHIKSGAVMDDPGAREAFGVADGQRVVAMIELGEPAAIPDPKVRKAARDCTTWVD